MRSPLDCRPTYAEAALRWDYGIEAWLKTLMMIGVRMRSTGAGAGTQLPLDPMIAAYQPLRDGGGPVIWTLLSSELYYMDLCGLG